LKKFYCARSASQHKRAERAGAQSVIVSCNAAQGRRVGAKPAISRKQKANATKIKPPGASPAVSLGLSRVRTENRFPLFLDALPKVVVGA
jgi:hypothetical protein